MTTVLAQTGRLLPQRAAVLNGVRAFVFGSTPRASLNGNLLACFYDEANRVIRSLPNGTNNIIEAEVAMAQDALIVATKSLDQATFSQTDIAEYPVGIATALTSQTPLAGGSVFRFGDENSRRSEF